MFALAIIIGVFSYSIFLIGISGYLYKASILLSFFISLFFFIVIQKSHLLYVKKNILNWLHKIDANGIFLLLVVVLQSIVNLAGALGPELGFDALWYHLTLPKIALENHTIQFFPGGLLYYSVMPQLGEMIYTASLALSNEISAKVIHFITGLLITIALYRCSRRYISRNLSLLAVVLYYSNLVVGWESTTAYIDLFRAFYEFLALWAFIEWYEKKKNIYFIFCAVFLGLAMSSKLLAAGSLGIFLFLILYINLHKGMVSTTRRGIIFFLVSFIILLPWLAFSYIQTGNPVYPFFTPLYPLSPNPSLFSPVTIVKDLWILFTKAQDPISPIYLIALPLIIFSYSLFSRKEKIIALYSLGALIVWYLTPRSGGGRFILPYLPAFSLLAVMAIAYYREKKILYNLLFFLILFSAFISIGYRAIANSKYLPVLFGKEEKKVFLSRHLNFSYGDFYDTDGFLKREIKQSDKVLLYGFHNLYYVDFPFIDSSWIRKGQRYNYIAVQSAVFYSPSDYNIPKQWIKIYENKTTHVTLYSDKKRQWIEY